MGERGECAAGVDAAELAAANKRFNDFVHEIATLNQIVQTKEIEPMADKQGRENAQQTFRQFAWNLAGTLASAKAGLKPPAAKPGKR